MDEWIVGLMECWSFGEMHFIVGAMWFPATSIQQSNNPSIQHSNNPSN
jgi:hypothetical protein